MGFVKSILEAKEYTLVTQEGPSIPHNRNSVFERARLEGDSLLFIDSDMVFTPQDIKRMEKHLETHDVVTGVCVMGFPGWPPAVFDEKRRPIENIKAEDGLFEIGSCGAAFLGISKPVIQTLIEPFTPLAEEKYGQYYGEDISFCMRAREAGFRIWCDPKLQIGHIKTVIKYYGKT